MSISRTDVTLMSRRAASTKTRIETVLDVSLRRGSSQCRRAASTKTRIETFLRLRNRSHPHRVAGRHPLKQGLKHISSKEGFHKNRVAGRHPLKQGLKPIRFEQQQHAHKRRRAASTKTRIETSKTKMYSRKIVSSQGGIH